VKIENSSINMFSAHSYSYERIEQERLLVWIGKRPEVDSPNSNQSTGVALRSGITNDLLNISSEARRAAGPKNHVPKKTSIPKQPLDSADHKIRLLEILLYMITGKKIKIKIFHPDELDSSDQQLTDNVSAAPEGQNSQGWGVEYDYHSSEKESETVLLKVEGNVTTSDGKEISLSLLLKANREFVAEQNISIRAGDAVKKDPIVINFSGGFAELTVTRYEFDIDADGVKDNISFVKPGSGFLAIDKNNDGVINDGNELFGPSTGDGFVELAAYDSDGNMWIDESDPIYKDLRVWTKDSSNKDVIYNLEDKKIGALFLGKIATPFKLNDSSNNTQGEITDSGIYLNNDGSAGLVQKLDLIA
jgi:hypothetical protein